MVPWSLVAAVALGYLTAQTAAIAYLVFLGIGVIVWLLAVVAKAVSE